MMRSIIFSFTLTVLACGSLAQSVDQPIFVDQFGYQSGFSNVAVLADPVIGYNAPVNYTPGTEVGLFVSGSDQMVAVYAPVPWNGGGIHAGSGDRGWWLDFSDWQMEGLYYLKDLQAGNVSPVFEIKKNVYEDVLTEAMRSFYYNRCGMAKALPFAQANWVDGESFLFPGQDADCRYVFDSTNANLVRDMRGGWFDAGDYNKYVTFAHSAVHNLLKSFQENPSIWTDDFQIPESGNGIPDLLDEVKYELDWLLRMNNPDGSTHIKLGSTNFNVNSNAPPSANLDSRFYGPTCTSASLAVAANFALAAMVFEDIPGMEDYADTLEVRAMRSWDFVFPSILSSNLETNCDDGTLVAGDADVDEQGQLNLALQGAVYLYMLTGQNRFSEYVEDAVDFSPPMASGFWGPYEVPLIDALLDYAEWAQGNPGIQDQIRNSFRQAVSNNWNGFFGFSDEDLYRAFMPDWSYHWGSNQPKALYGVLNMLATRFSSLPSASFVQKAYDQLHYFHGVNPQGMVYLSNMYHVGGDFCANEIYHTWFYDGTDWDHAQLSKYGPAPGFVTGGPNQSFSVTTLQPPYGQPRQKAYLDFNDGWPLNSWEITEPAIYYQAAYVRLLAYFTQKGNTTSTSDSRNSDFSISPNPAKDIIAFPKNPLSKGKIYSSEGQLLKSWNEVREEVEISGLAKGNYLLFGYDEASQKWISRKFIKL